MKKPDESYYAKLPKKRIVAAVLTFFEDRLLIVKPTYQEYWLVPGGVVELFESPFTAALREFKEEIGFAIEIEKLLAVDYASTEVPFKDEALHFVFRARDLAKYELNKIKLPHAELSEHRFVTLIEAQDLLGSTLAGRIKSALEKDRSGLLTESGKIAF